jgi:thymidylate synthase
MSDIDRVLGDLQKEIELYGRSGAESIFKTDVVFTISARAFDVPSGADAEGAIIDFEWFLECATNGRVTAHPNPDRSWWLERWGMNAEPYGYRWRFDTLKKHLTESGAERRAVLFNPGGHDKPPCILCYQFQEVNCGVLDCTIFMRSSDVAKVLPQDIAMTRLLVKHVANMVGLKAGNMTFHVGNAHVFYKDCDFPEEHIFDIGL